MKIIVTSVFLVLSLAIFSDAASAGRAGRRQANQRARIQEGVQSGELTQGEAARARAEQRHVRRMKKQAGADGQVTGEERAAINQEQNKASRQIHHLRHNDKSNQE